jgi:L-cysteine/cystine lyase
MDRQGKPVAWKQTGEKYEVATSAYPEYEGLRTAIAIHQSWGTATERYQRICELSQYLWEKLQQIEQINCLKHTPPAAGLVSFQVKGINHKQLVDDLERQQFFLRTIGDPNCIRACVHYLTLPAEIDLLIDTIKAELVNH